ncbi:MAG: hypothetical protein V4760_01735, partial [Bdellovibrionota bacterium]
MSIETEPLKLLPHRLRATRPGCWAIETPDGRVIEVPVSFGPLISETQKGTSIAALADVIRGESSENRFTRLVRFLLFLDDSLTARKRSDMYA